MYFEGSLFDVSEGSRLMFMLEHETNCSVGLLIPPVSCMVFFPALNRKGVKAPSDLQCYNPEVRILHSHHRENFESKTVRMVKSP
jgi:hypothetical protein